MRLKLNEVLFIAPLDLKMHRSTSIRILSLAKAATRVCEEVFLASCSIDEELETPSNLVLFGMKYLQPCYHIMTALVNDINNRLASKLLTKLFKLGLSAMRSTVNVVDVIHAHQRLLSSCLAKMLREPMSRRAPIVVDLHDLLRLQGLMGEPLWGGTLANAIGLPHGVFVFGDESIAAFYRAV